MANFTGKIQQGTRKQDSDLVTVDWDGSKYVRGADVVYEEIQPTYYTVTFYNTDNTVKKRVSVREDDTISSQDIPGIDTLSRPADDRTVLGWNKDTSAAITDDTEIYPVTGYGVGEVGVFILMGYKNGSTSDSSDKAAKENKIKALIAKQFELNGNVDVRTKLGAYGCFPDGSRRQSVYIKGVADTYTPKKFIQKLGDTKNPSGIKLFIMYVEGTVGIESMVPSEGLCYSETTGAVLYPSGKTHIGCEGTIKNHKFIEKQQYFSTINKISTLKGIVGIFDASQGDLLIPGSYKQVTPGDTKVDRNTENIKTVPAFPCKIFASSNSNGDLTFTQKDGNGDEDFISGITEYIEDSGLLRVRYADFTSSTNLKDKYRLNEPYIGIYKSWNSDNAVFLR